MNRKLSFAEFIALDKVAWERRRRDPAFNEEQRKIAMLTEEERAHWVETGEWPPRLR